MGSYCKDSDISDSEIDDHAAKSYSLLKDGKLKVKYSDSCYRCPFCAGKKKQDYQYKDLLQHATGLSCSLSRSGKVKANHCALANLLKNDLSNADGLSQTVKEQEPRNPQKDQFVWPWMGILVTPPIINKDGRFVGEGRTKIEEELHQFNPLEVHALSSFNEHFGKFIVYFSRDWAGFNNAMAFEKFFEAKHLGKRHWNGRRDHGSDMYGWVARDDDYHSRCLIGDHLRKIGDLTTITDLEKEESWEEEKHVSLLADEIELKNKKFQELDCMFNTTSKSLDKMMEDRDIMLQAHSQGLREVRHRYREKSRRIIEKNEKMMLEMERKLNDNKKKLASFEQKEADVNILRLVEEQMGERDDIVEKMREVVRQEDAKHKLELETEHMKGQLQFVSHNKNEVDDNMRGLYFLNVSYQTLMVNEVLSNDELEDFRKALITGIEKAEIGRRKQRSRKDDSGLKAAAEFCSKWQERYPKDDSDLKVAAEFCSKWQERYPKDDADLKAAAGFSSKWQEGYPKEDADLKAAAEFSSKWQEQVEKPDFHPFKWRRVDGKDKEVMDERARELRPDQDLEQETIDSLSRPHQHQQYSFFGCDPLSSPHQHQQYSFFGCDFGSPEPVKLESHQSHRPLFDERPKPKDSWSDLDERPKPKDSWSDLDERPKPKDSWSDLEDGRSWNSIPRLHTSRW